MDIQNTQLPMATGNGCGCCSTPSTPSGAATTIPEDTEGTQTFPVSGMTCGHCANAVTAELETLAGVSAVTVDLVAGGTSTVTVLSQAPLAQADVAAALQEAGDYQLVDG
jgi:copper chaperone CopZ